MKKLHVKLVTNASVGGHQLHAVVSPEKAPKYNGKPNPRNIILSPFKPV